ncbi:MAG TPA: amidohydrolase family protein [Puia sp.]|nr:amidohydrolase family protein [Puia sp.]
MTYRKFSADHLFTGYEMLDDHYVLIVSSDGTIQDIRQKTNTDDQIESFHGILCPGFINSHCHLELSHMKELIPEQKGLVDFVFAVVTQRHFPQEEIYDAISRAEEEMLNRGIVAVGDICNNADTIAQKRKGRLKYYNFIEVSGWSPQIAESRFSKSKSFFDSFRNISFSDPGQKLSMAPHAPYSVSDPLWDLIIPFFRNKTTSIHNQESRFENEFFIRGSGDFTRMYELMNIDNSFFKPSGKSSLQSYLPKLKDAANTILVHNTFIQEEDINYSLAVEEQSRSGTNLFFCVCANANLYIENKVPPIDLLRKHGSKIVLGTDSLASNHQLDILAEIKTIHQYFPEIPLNELLQWATINGAGSLQMDDVLGSFTKGKKPGIVLIENINGLKPDKSSIARKIL